MESSLLQMDLLNGHEPSDVGQASQPAGSRGILASCSERQDAARTGRQDVCPTGSWEASTILRSRIVAKSPLAR
jgi:hypothetical protein